MPAVSPDYGFDANKRILRTTDDLGQCIREVFREDRQTF